LQKPQPSLPPNPLRARDDWHFGTVAMSRSRQLNGKPLGAAMLYTLANMVE
jgi:hypothetical protein